MKTLIYNFGYFLKEAGKTIRLNPLSNLFSVLGTGLILFLLGMVLTGWSVGNRLIDALQQEAEISVYFDNTIDREASQKLVETIKGMDGVWNASYISETEAQTRMKEMLGDEANILGLFSENPFEAFIEVRINLNSMDTVIDQIKAISGVDYVRDNRLVLKQMKDITQGLTLLGYLVIVAVGITTVIIISHMIRQGIYNNKDQINTLRLLGAPSSFIGFPFVLAGLLLTILGGLMAAGLLIYLIENGYQQLSGSIPFIPLPPKEELKNTVGSLIIGISVVLGLAGSFFGLSSIRKNETNG